MKIRIQLIMLISVFVALTGAIVYLVIIPTMNDIQAISQAVYQERVDLERKYLRGQLLKQTIDDYAQVKDQLPILSQIFLVTGEELDFIRFLETTAARHAITQDIDLNLDNRTKKTGDLMVLPFSLTFSGRFDQVMNYLEDLERSPQYLVISALNLTAASQYEQRLAGGISGTLQATIYEISNEIK